jgi:hypothetical protein
MITALEIATALIELAIKLVGLEQAKGVISGWDVARAAADAAEAIKFPTASKISE